MEYFDHFFGKANIFALTFRGGRVINMNEMAKNLLSGSTPILEYIMDSSRYLDTFDVIFKNGLYRMVRTTINGEVLVLGVDISDIKMKEYYLRKTNRLQEKRIEGMLAFSDLVIHDIKNYLFMLSGYMELLEEEYNPQHLQEMKRVLEGMKHLIAKSSLLIKDPKEFQKKAKLSVRKVMERAIHAVSMDAKRKNIKIVKKFRGESIYADPIIVEAFVNVLHNAIKYSPENGKVEIETESEDDSVAIKIKDEGPGIPDAYKESIFERFKRGTSMMGMGLGLATTKYLVEANDGKIWVEDNEPQGSIFVIQLPKK